MDRIEIEALEYDARTLANLREQIDFATVMMQSCDPNTLVPVGCITELLEKLREVANSDE